MSSLQLVSTSFLVKARKNIKSDQGLLQVSFTNPKDRNFALFLGNVFQSLTTLIVHFLLLLFGLLCFHLCLPGIFLVAACDDCFLHVYSAPPRRVWPCLLQAVMACRLMNCMVTFKFCCFLLTMLITILLFLPFSFPLL